VLIILTVTELLMEFWVLRVVSPIIRQGWELKGGVLLFEYNCMHSVHWAIVIASWEKSLALDCAGHNVADQGVFLWQVSGEVHFLPLEPLSNPQAREPEVRTYCVSLHEVE
jgi:hypothetical protein